MSDHTFLASSLEGRVARPHNTPRLPSVSSRLVGRFVEFAGSLRRKNLGTIEPRFRPSRLFLGCDDGDGGDGGGGWCDERGPPRFNVSYLAAEVGRDDAPHTGRSS